MNRVSRLGFSLLIVGLVAGLILIAAPLAGLQTPVATLFAVGGVATVIGLVLTAIVMIQRDQQEEARRE